LNQAQKDVTKYDSLIKESGKKGVWVGPEEKGLYDKAKQCTFLSHRHICEERETLGESKRKERANEQWLTLVFTPIQERQSLYHSGCQLSYLPT
jgi:hypothetical protein